jgi:hypothetical protein
MKIKMLTSMAGVDFAHNKDDVVEYPDATAIRYIEAGIAEAVKTEVVERATAKTKVEKAAK